MLEFLGQEEDLLVLNSPSKTFNLQTVKVAYGVYGSSRQQDSTLRFIDKLYLGHDSRLALAALEVYLVHGQDHARRVSQEILKNFAYFR